MSRLFRTVDQDSLLADGSPCLARERERANPLLRRHLEAMEDNPREAKGDHHESNEGEGREEDTPADPELVEDEDEGELNGEVEEIGRIGKIAELRDALEA